jgi:CMP-2-keto-3-deoxyoctulosonic acid synthetase
MPDWPYKLDKTVISIGTHAEHKAAEKAFWLSKTPLERLEALELMRQINYGYNPDTDRVQRVLKILELEES